MNDEMDTLECVALLGQLMRLSSPEHLAAEMAEHPIAAAFGALDREAVEAIETAGPMAAVELMSIVGSKGLSAYHVMIIGCDDVNLGRTNQLTFFVGMTRARESLHLIASMKAGGSTAIHPFLLGLPAANCEYVIYKKTGRRREKLANPRLLDGRVQSWRRASSRSGG
jgi:superfamily I DNA/RNA helicase